MQDDTKSTSSSTSPGTTRFRCQRWDAFLALHRKSLSHNRLLLRMPQAPPKGETLRVQLDLPRGLKIELTGQVARTAPPGEGEKLARVGLVLDIDAEKARELSKLVALGQAATTGHLLSLSELEDALSQEVKPARSAPEVGVRRECLEPDAEASSEIVETPRKTPPKELDAGRLHLAVKAKREAPIVGIDFGTSYCSVGYLTEEGATLIPDDEGRTAIPSVVWFRGPGDYVVGYDARERLAVDPARTIPSVKRLLGCTIDDEAAGPILMSLACSGHAGPNRSIVFDLNGESQTPVQIAAIILRHLTAMAKAHLGAPVTRAVMAYPLAFTDRQKTALERAARIAGLEIVELVPEPIAAAMAYGRAHGPDGSIAVYDFGGGTFDFCAINLMDGRLQVACSGGDPWLGGDDFDLAIANHVAETFWRETKIDLRSRAAEWQRILHASEEAKVYLSMVPEIDVYVPDVATTRDGPLDLQVKITRKLFDALTRDIVRSSLAVCQQALRDAKLDVHRVRALMLTGGTTKIPAIRQATRAFFGQEPSTGIPAEQAVVLGTSLLAAARDGLIPSPIQSKPVPLREVAPSTLGIALAGGRIAPIIKKSTPLPTVVRKVYATSKDGQTSFALKLMEVDSPTSRGPCMIGSVNVPDLKSLPAGQVRVEVTFLLEKTGELKITARDLESGRTYVSSIFIGEEPSGARQQTRFELPER